MLLGSSFTHSPRLAQGILIDILVGTGAMDTAEDGSNLQNLLICLEMLPASIAMFYAFPYTEYTEGGENVEHPGFPQLVPHSGSACSRALSK